MAEFWPVAAPDANGLLDGGDGNRVAWTACGNPNGCPIVLLHGGPESGSSASLRRCFDSGAWRICQFDQRGCGDSLPHARDPAIDMSFDTTAYLVADIERLRTYFGVERWCVFGSSWGSTLALA